MKDIITGLNFFKFLLIDISRFIVIPIAVIFLLYYIGALIVLMSSGATLNNILGLTIFDVLTQVSNCPDSPSFGYRDGYSWVLGNGMIFFFGAFSTLGVFCIVRLSFIFFITLKDLPLCIITIPKKDI